MCVIADDSGAIGLGGVMGGESTGCSIDTADVFIESAYFDANRTARTGRATGIISDARFRNERGIDPHSCVDGIELATKLILDECAAAKPSESRCRGQGSGRARAGRFKPRDMKRLTGLDMSPCKRMEQILRALGFEPVVPPKAQHDAQDVWGDQGAVVAS
jgi:phenylalanyl-tRNA synthetase beta chain